MDSSFWHRHGDLISAVITMAVAIAVAFAIDRFVIGRATQTFEDTIDVAGAQTVIGKSKV